MPVVNTSELTGAALDWAVAICEGFHKDTPRFMELFTNMNRKGQGYCWSTSWVDGGPIIEREMIFLEPTGMATNAWGAALTDGTDTWGEYGITPLIAAMRCYVASKLGDEVDVPEGIL